ncbi:FAD-dependent oxidoreductase [Microbacterium lushaniae]|uniref:Flavodoxin reductase n=1 Tax=Microbacterium lushaniae TaxID=2614639 RepID=A0A5J6L5G6_9MICO|nr:flavodoxin reductase [Microbacterium lushaniae]QEW03670.1 flavodoxin reductase [Microbacterium lushaniae]
MIGALTAGWTRVFGVLGRLSSYRLVLLSLAALAAIAVVLSLAGLVGPGPLELIVTALVLAVVCVVVDVALHRMLRVPPRVESSLITAAILLFVLFPTLDPAGLAGIALAGAVASLSKYLLAWRGRHVFNPAAVGAAALTLVGIAVPALGASAWWVGTPAMAAPVLVLGVAVLWRTEKLRMVAGFWVIAAGVAFLRAVALDSAAGVEVDALAILTQVTLSSPYLFLGAFMLSEPLTMPPRRWQQFAVAALVGVLAGWPIDVGAFTLGQEFALLAGNAFAFAFTWRAAVRLVLEGRRDVTPTVRELTFRARRPFAFRPGQYLELEVPHRRPDARGTRREFSIASAPGEMPVVRIAFKEGSKSSYKRALAEVPVGATLAVTGVWGDFLLPTRSTAPLLLVAAGIGVTPFVSQLRHLVATEADRDIVLIYVASDASELAYREEIERSGIPVVVYSRDAPPDLPAQWRWAGRGVRVDAEGLLRMVPDITARHAYISGPPALLADLAPALDRARSLTTDAFSGY